MPTSWNDRRSAHRTQVAYRLDTWDDRGNFLGCILDLSTLGVRVLLLEETSIERAKGIRLDFPRWLGLGEGLELKGRFVWCKTQRETGETEAGFSFDAVPSAQLRTLERLIETLSGLYETT